MEDLFCYTDVHQLPINDTYMHPEFDFNSTGPKVFIDTAHLRIINGLMYLALQSGEDAECYVLPLPLAKLVGKAITTQVAEIEEKNGVTFNDRLPNEPTPSPWSSQNPESPT